MGINIGSQEIEGLQKDFDKVYVGNVEVWSSYPNTLNVISNYQLVQNDYIKSIDVKVVRDSWAGNRYGKDTSVAFGGWFSYDANGNATSGSVYADFDAELLNVYKTAIVTTWHQRGDANYQYHRDEVFGTGRTAYSGEYNYTIDLTNRSSNRILMHSGGWSSDRSYVRVKTITFTK